MSKDRNSGVQDLFSFELSGNTTHKSKNNTDENILEIQECDFPMLLKKSSLRPKRLFFKGKLPSEDSIGVAMVGTRRPSNSARELCRRLVHSLAGTKAVIVSGLAQGIDSYCHEAALEVGLPTVAVLAQGLQVPIPGERSLLARRIVEAGGCLLTEYPGSTPSYRGSFPARNRIISGLSRSVVLVQSKTKGGALITADFCLQEKKQLLAIPGDFDSEVSSGPNLYLDQGKAVPLFRPESLPLVAGIQKSKSTADNSYVESISQLQTLGCNLSQDALNLFKRFNGFRKTFPDIQKESNLLTVNILAILTELEIAGLVETRDNFQFYFNGIV